MIWFFVSDQSLKIFRCREAKQSALLEIKSVCSFGVVMLSATSFALVASWLTQLPATEQCLVAGAQLQVSVVGMGDGTDADFPAIYADLFGERTFEPSKGGWDYDYFTSYALPDFVG